MKDIFRDAKFRDGFIAEGGMTLVYIRYKVREQHHMLVSPLGRYIYCDNDGRNINKEEKQYNVIEKL